MKRTRSVIGAAALAAALVAGLGAVASSAEAQRIPADKRGAEACFHRPGLVPGLWGMPQWPTGDNAAAVTNASDPTNSQSISVAEPRWGFAPLVPLAYPNNSDRARFRVLTLPTATTSERRFAVQIQIVTDYDNMQPDDYIWFGFAPKDNTNTTDGIDSDHAWAVQVTPYKADNTGNAAAIGHNRTVLASGLRGYTFDRGRAPTWQAMTTAVTGATFTNVQYWNDPAEEAANGAKWTVEFKVVVPTNFAVEEGRFFVAAHTGSFVDNGETKGYDSASANIFTGGCGSVECTMYPGQTGAVTAGLPADPDDWGNLSQALSGSCKGVAVQSIASMLSADGPNVVNTDGGENNQFDVGLKTTDTAGAPLVLDTVSADVFIANWGSVASPDAGWARMTDPLNPPHNSPTKTTITHSCVNTGNASGPRNICGKVSAANILSADHQCMQVQLHQVSSSSPVPLDVPSMYANMFYDHASEVSQLAEVSVKGLQAILKNTNARTVYLHVVKRNMPMAGTTSMALNTKALDALRAEVDPTFASSDLTCDQGPNDRCFATGQSNQCMRPASLDEDGYYCPLPNEDWGPPVVINGASWCPVAGTDACVPSAGGGLDRNISALTPNQAVRAQWPNYEVYPYYESGKTVTINGKSNKQLVPMPSFGLYVTHEGSFYGWLDSLVEETGSLTSPTSRLLTQVGPDLYKLTIPNEGVARLRVKLATADRAPDPFFEIVGTATPLGLTLGNATFTGVARTRNIDLSAATVTIQTLLESGGKELVTNKVGTITLTRQLGALPGLATFTRTSSYPNVSMQVARLPLVGQTVAMQVTRASISVPTSCPFSLGSATIKSQFTITDPAGSVIVYGSDKWLCVPGQLLNF